jgi:hypothetical protein
LISASRLTADGKDNTSWCIEVFAEEWRPDCAAASGGVPGRYS